MIIPPAILHRRGITIIVRKLGIYSVQSSKLIYLIDLIRYSPDKIIATTIATGGINKKIGKKKRAIPNIIAAVKAVRPVLPPSIIPVALSMYGEVELIPSTDPIIELREQARSACRILSR